MESGGHYPSQNSLIGKGGGLRNEIQQGILDTKAVGAAPPRDFAEKRVGITLRRIR